MSGINGKIFNFFPGSVWKIQFFLTREHSLIYTPIVGLELSAFEKITI